MNIQQLRYVVAIANSGTFREAASKLFVSQPSLSVAIKDLEQELNFQIFTRTTTGAVLTSQGMTFYERALEVVRSFDSFENRYLNASEKGNQFSIASQHYDFLPPLITTFSERYPDYKDFRIFESTTIQILDEVAKGHSEIGIIYLNRQNSKGIQQNMDKLGLEAIDLIPFKTHIYLRKGHPLAKKESLVMEDLAALSDRILVLSEGRLFRLGTPAEVFADAAALKAVGLGAPAPEAFAASLREAGFTLGRDLYDERTLAADIAAQLRGGADDA